MMINTTIITSKTEDPNNGLECICSITISTWFKRKKYTLQENIAYSCNEYANNGVECICYVFLSIQKLKCRFKIIERSQKNCV